MRTFRLERAWRLMLRDLGVHPGHVMARAGLPADLLSRPSPTVDTDGYFRLWNAVVAEIGDPDIGLLVGQGLSVEMFDPALFAALCSPDLNTAATRLARFKPLVGPFTLDVDVRADRTVLTFGCLDAPDLPASLGGAELVFWVHFARLATRTPVRPVSFTLVEAPADLAAWEAFVGSPVTLGSAYAVAFSQLDAQRPFLTADAAMWEAFEPGLRQRLSELDEQASAVERVRAALLQLLPVGQGTIGDVARTLGMSPRSLQRKLGAEATSFQAQLADVRAQLARHYLATSDLPGAEISFLLGYDDPNSFFRAFQQWTGQTPERMRAGLRGAGA